MMPVHKNRWNQTGKDRFIFASMMLMLVSLLVSRAALSISVILFLVLTIVGKNFKTQWKRFYSNFYFVCFTLLFFVPFLSGLWSEDKSQWLDVVRLKLPLAFFPLSFAGVWQLTKQQGMWVSAVFIAVVFAGCVYGLVDYALHTAEVHEGYLKAKTILTPLENDHVRFSWLVAVAVIACFFFNDLFRHRKTKFILYALAIFFIGYLHLLSARTGLLSLYLFLILYAGRLLYQKRRNISLLLIGLFICLPVGAYFFIPTFQNRLRYFVYDFSFVKKEEYLPGANDGARVMSLKAGWQVLRKNPLGAGAGDIMHEADKWYAANVPQVLPTDKFYPSSEWLIYGAMAGWMGVIIFTAVMLMPFFYLSKQFRIYWICFHAIAAFSFLFDMGLEVQYGIFLYAFIPFWWWKLMSNR